MSDLHKATLNRHDFMRQYGLKLLENGYNIIPIEPGKKYPLLDGWQNTVATPALVQAWIEKKPHYGIGILMDRVICIDVDVLHTSISTKLKVYIEEVTGSRICVSGKRPKTAYIYRPEEDWETHDPIPVGKQAYGYYLPSNPEKSVKLEILYGDFQKVAFGIHPDTGKPYTWDYPSKNGQSKFHRGCPLNVHRDDLPVLTNAQLKLIITEYKRLCEDAGLEQTSSRAATATNLSNQDREFLAIEQRLKLNDEIEGLEVMADIQSAVEYLRDHPEDLLGLNGRKGTYDNWQRVGQALASAKGTALEDTCFELWLSTCRSPEEAERKWQSFKADFTGYPALFTMAARFGWQNPKAKSENLTEASRQRVMFFPLGSAKPKPIDWLITDLIETDCLGMVYGDSGVGKTFMVLDMALSVATGIPYHSKPVKQGAVFYIAGEGRNGITRRRGAWQHQRGVTQEQMEMAPIYCSDGSLILNMASAKDIVQAAIDLTQKAGEEPRLVVLDTLARTMEGDENSAKDFNHYLQAATAIQDRFKCTVLIVHHTGKDNGRGARGSSAIKAGMDFSYALEKSGAAVTLKCEKLKDGEQPQPMTFSLQSVVFEAEIEGGSTDKLTSLVPTLLDAFAAIETTQEDLWPIEAIKLPNKATNARKLQKLIIDQHVKQHCDDDKPLSIPLITLERHFSEITGKSDSRAFKRAVESLLKAAVVSTGNDSSLLIIHRRSS